MNSTDFWKKYYSLPKVMLVILFLIVSASILYVVGLNAIHEYDTTDDVILNNNNIKQLFGNMIFYVLSSFVFGVIISAIAIYLACLYNPKCRKKNQKSRIQNMIFDFNTRGKNWQSHSWDKYMQKSYNDKLDRLISEIELFLK